MLDAFLNAGERELAAVFLNLLHAFNEDRETGTVEVRDFGKIDNHDFRLLGNDRTQRFRDLRRNVEVDLAFKRQNIRLFLWWHRTGNWRRLSQFSQASLVDHQPSVFIRRSISERASVKLAG